jgi:hypothetical protein
MGLAGEIGELRVGARADLVLLDLFSPTFLPLTNLANHLAYGEDGASVRRVLVDGRVVVSDGEVLTVDEEALLAEVRELMPAWLEALEPASAWVPASAAGIRRALRAGGEHQHWLQPLDRR